ncbi:hypothetical protein VTK26DRAFT_3755 [Humicola hyalothermophila]
MFDNQDLDKLEAISSELGFFVMRKFREITPRLIDYLESKGETERAGGMRARMKEEDSCPSPSQGQLDAWLTACKKAGIDLSQWPQDPEEYILCQDDMGPVPGDAKWSCVIL